MFYISTVPEFSVNISIKITANIEIAVIFFTLLEFRGLELLNHYLHNILQVLLNYYNQFFHKQMKYVILGFLQIFQVFLQLHLYLMFYNTQLEHLIRYLLDPLKHQEYWIQDYQNLDIKNSHQQYLDSSYKRITTNIFINETINIISFCLVYKC